MENINISVSTIFNFAKVVGEHIWKHLHNLTSLLWKFRKIPWKTYSLASGGSKILINELSEVLNFFLFSWAQIIIAQQKVNVHQKYDSFHVDTGHKLKVQLTSRVYGVQYLVPFSQFKKREKQPWRSVIFSKVAGSMGAFHFLKIVQIYG